MKDELAPPRRNKYPLVPEVSPPYSLPTVIDQLGLSRTITEVGASPGQRSWGAPIHNRTSHYDLIFTEDSTFVTLEAEVLRVAPKAPSEFYSRLMDISSAAPDGRLDVQRGIQVDNSADCDLVQYSKKIRKVGLPSQSIVEEVVAFDAGIEDIYPQVRSAALQLGAHMLPSTASPVSGTYSSKGLPHAPVAEESPFDKDFPKYPDSWRQKR
jgi:hypothetical protein